MKNPANYPTVKHNISLHPRMVPDENGELVQKGSIIRIEGPGLPGIHYDYEDPSLPQLLTVKPIAELLKKPAMPRRKLWGDYWHAGQLCLLTGDMGVGKTTVGLQLARAIAEGHNGLTPDPSPKERGEIESGNERERGEIERVNERERDGVEITHPVTAEPCHPSQEGINKNKVGEKVVFMGFELAGEDLTSRLGGGEVNENFIYANIAGGVKQQDMAERLPKSIEKLLSETDAKVLIIDQPDRLHFTPAAWNLFMLKLNEVKVQRGVSILLILNNKPRNLSKPPTISSMYRSNQLAPHADSIVCIANHGRKEGKRYLKLLKNTRLPLPAENAPVEVFEIGIQNVHPDDKCRDAQNVQIILQPPTILSVQACGEEDGEKVVQLSPLAKRNKLMMDAEDYRYAGMSFREIAVKMELPERTVRRWVGFIKAEIERVNERESDGYQPLLASTQLSVTEGIERVNESESVDFPHPSPLPGGEGVAHPVTPLVCNPTDAAVGNVSSVEGTPPPPFRHPLREGDSFYPDDECRDFGSDLSEPQRKG
jgi:hypothetical protein